MPISRTDLLGLNNGHHGLSFNVFIFPFALGIVLHQDFFSHYTVFKYTNNKPCGFRLSQSLDPDWQSHYELNFHFHFMVHFSAYTCRVPHQPRFSIGFSGKYTDVKYRDQSKESGLNRHALYSSFEFQLRAI